MVRLSRSRAPRTASAPSMTRPRSRSATPVIRFRSPNRPTQPLVHGDSPSGGTRWVPRHNASSPVARAGSRLWVRERSAPAWSWALRKQVSDGSDDWDPRGGEPRRAWVPSSMPRMVILILPVLLGVRPGTFGSGCSAPSFTVQASSVGCRHRQRVHRQLYAVAGVHRGPLAFIYGHEITSVTYVTSRLFVVGWNDALRRREKLVIRSEAVRCGENYLYVFKAAPLRGGRSRQQGDATHPARRLRQRGRTCSPGVLLFARRSAAPATSPTLPRPEPRSRSFGPSGRSTLTTAPAAVSGSCGGPAVCRPTLTTPSTGVDIFIRGAQMHPVLGRVVEERQQLVRIVGDLRDRLGELHPVGPRNWPSAGTKSPVDRPCRYARSKHQVEIARRRVSGGSWSPAVRLAV